MNKELEINLGDTCYQAINPEYTTTGECVLKCTVVGLYKHSYFDMDDNVVESVHQVEVSYGTFDENSKVDIKKIFLTEDDAYISVESTLLARESDLENKLAVINKNLELVAKIKEN